MTNFEWLRQRLLSNYGLLDVHDFGTIRKSITELRQSEWNPHFERLMRNRLLMGCFRYGLMQDPNKGAFDQISSAERRITLYKQTGNMEHLVDVANLMLVEFTHPNHPKVHWAPTDDGQHCDPIRKD